MEALLRDVRYATRMLFRTPGVSLIAIITVALGVGLTTHTFSTVYGTVIRGLPFEHGQRLLHLSGTVPADGIVGRSVSIHDYTDWREQQTAFEDLAAFHWGTINLADDENRPARYQGAFVTANLFAEVGAQPAMGRLFSEEETSGLGSGVILLAHHVWQARYAGDPGIVGRTVRANGRPATVIGIMPDGFKFPFDHDAWMPMDIHRDGLQRGEGGRMDVVGRLRAGTTQEEAQTELDHIAGRLAAEFPETNAGTGAYVHPYEHEIMPPEITAVMYLMLAAVFGVLFIACANVANLLLARSAARSREVAIRSALGASRGIVIRQLLIEAMVLAAVGGAVGTLLSIGGVNIFNNVIADITKPYWIDIRTDGTALGFAVIITMLASLVAGIVPALKASGVAGPEVLKDQGRGSTGMRLSRFSTGLVVAEIAVSCALLIGAGMMVKSVVQLKTLDLGFETGNILTARVTLPNADYETDGDRLRFFETFEERLNARPGLELASVASDLPATGAGQYWFGIDGTLYPTDQDYPFANGSIVTPGFFDTFGVNIAEGRGFTAQDRDDGVPVTVVNQSFARRHFGTASPLGQRIRIGRSDSERPFLTIIGVVPDLHVGGGVGGIGSGQRIPEHFYRTLAQNPVQTASVAVRTTGDPLTASGALREAVATLDPNLPVYDVDSMDGTVESATWVFGIFGSLFSIFGVIALFMSAVGLYGVMAFSVTSRTQEMGIRMALGASAANILRMVFRKGFLQLGAGMLIGLALGAGMSRPLAAVMFKVNPGDLSVYAVIVGVLSVAGMLACLVPARRATRVDLVDALKPH